MQMLEGVNIWLQFLVCTMECVVVNSDVGYVVGIVSGFGSMSSVEY